MKAILIDPETQSVSEINFEGDFKEVQKILNVDCFTVVGFDNNDAVYIDDNGLFAQDYFFAIPQYPYQPLAGRGLILGTDAGGDSCDCKTTLENIKKNVKFFTRQGLAIASRLCGSDLTYDNL